MGVKMFADEQPACPLRSLQTTENELSALLRNALMRVSVRPRVRWNVAGVPNACRQDLITAEVTLHLHVGLEVALVKTETL